MLRTALLGILVGTAGCGSDENAAATATTQVTPVRGPSAAEGGSLTTSTTTAVHPANDLALTDPSAELIASVRAFWALYLAVGAAGPGLDGATVHARLAERTTGTELAQLDAFFATNAKSGFVVRGEIDSAPAVIQRSDTTAQVRDCHDDRSGLFRADGTRVDTDNPLRHQVLLTLVRDGDRWKVASIKDEGFGCAA